MNYKILDFYLFLFLLSLAGCSDKRTVTVSGAVNRPGDYSYQSEWKVENYVTAAGGYTPTAINSETRLVRIKRDSTGAELNRSWWPLGTQPEVLPGDLILVPRRTYEVQMDTVYFMSDLVLEWEENIFRIPEGFVVPGWTDEGVTVVAVLGDGECRKRAENVRLGNFQYLYIRLHPAEYTKVLPAIYKPVLNREVLEDAIGVHQSLVKRFGFQVKGKVEIPPERYIQVVAGVWPQPKSMELPGPGMRKKHYPDGREWTTFPDGRQRIVYPDKRVKVVFPTGGQEKRYPDGRLELQDVKGNVEVRHPDGKVIVSFADGDQEERYPDGRIVQKFKAGTKRTILANGTERTRFIDGTIHVKYKDGTVEIRSPKGVQETRYADGRVAAVTSEGHEVTVYQDGRRLIRAKDGTTLEEFRDGRKVQRGLQGEWIEVLSDGSKRTVFKDGSELLQKKDGSRMERHANGTTVELFPNGRRVQADAKGNRLEAFPDGRELQTDAKGNRLETFPDGRKVQQDAQGNQVTVLPDGIQIKTFVDAHKYWGSLQEGLVEVDPTPERLIFEDSLVVTGTMLDSLEEVLIAVFRLPDGDVIQAHTKREGLRFTGVFRDSMLVTPGYYRLQVRAVMRERFVMVADRSLMVGDPQPLGEMVLTVLPFKSKENANSLVVEMVNEARLNAGISPLEIDSQLMELAQRQVWTMASTGAFISAPTMADADNIARGPSVEEVHMYMLMSVGHRKSILDPRWKYLGVAVEQRQEEIWVAEVFAQQSNGVSSTKDLHGATR